MIIGKLVGRAALPIMDATEVAAWAASNPVADDIVLSSETGSFLVSDGSGGYADTGIEQVSLDEGNFNTGTATYTWLIGKRILSFHKNATLLRVVAGTPASAAEVKYDNTTGVLTLFTGQTFNGDWVHILYDRFTTV